MGYKQIYFLLHLLLISGLITAQQKPFTLTGTIKGTTGGYIYLSYAVDYDVRTIYKKDSSLIKNGQFTFKGTFSGPAAEATLSMRRETSRTGEKITFFYLVPGDMQLSLDYQNFRGSVVQKGSLFQTQADSLEKSKTVIYEQKNIINDAYRKANALFKKAVETQQEGAIVESLKEAADLVKAAIDPLDKQAAKIDLAFMDQYSTSFLTASLLRRQLSQMSFKEGQERYNKLPEGIKNTYVGKSIKGELDRLGKAVGFPAFPFASTELRGEELKLSDYKGKYVLLDFWASWCGPCRKSHPHLFSLYTKYKDQGLEIIGIASDSKNPEAWKKAINKDAIAVWRHVLDDQWTTPEGESSISHQYKVTNLPTKILVDPNGVIIGRYGAGGETHHEALDWKLAELFGF